MKYSAEQGLLFDVSEVKKEATSTTIDTSNVDVEALNSLAFLYTSTEKGSSTGVRFMMSIEDAMAWCQSSVSKGCIHGTEWAYFFTTVWQYVNFYSRGEEDMGLHVETTGLIDNGQWDERIAELGLKKIDILEFDTILPPLGVTVIRGKSITKAIKRAA